MTFKKYLILSACIYCICIAIRFYYPFILESYPQYFFYNAPLLNTHDSYFYAQGARDLLDSLLSFKNDGVFKITKSTLHSPTGEFLAIIGAIFAWFSPLSLEWILFLLPGFLGTLVIFPIMFLTRNFGSFPCILSGLLGALSISYYNRTMFGYFDTDMLIIPLGVSIAILAIQTNKTLGFASLFALCAFALGYYPNLRYLLFGFIVILLFLRKDFVSFGLMCGALLCTIFSNFIPLWIILCFLLGFLEKQFMRHKHIIFFSIICVFLGFLFIRILPSFLDSPFIQKNPLNVAILNSIMETSPINFLEFTKRTSGGFLLFLLSAFGYILLVLQSKKYLIFLPFLILGAFSLLKGLRFSFYAIPVFALGGAYLCFYCLKYFHNKILKAIFVFSFFALFLIPHLIHIKSYITKPILNNLEAKILQDLSQLKEENYAITWWDYGYMVQYFAKMNTFADGGNFIRKNLNALSLAFLTTDNSQSAKIFKTLYQNRATHPYIILPLQMLEIFPQIAKFSNTEDSKAPFFAISKTILTDSKGDKIAKFKDFSLHLKNGILQTKDFNLTIHSLKNLQTNTTQIFHHKSTLKALLLKDNRLILCDSFYMDSFYFQGLFFETLNTDLFKKVLKNDKITIYKLQ